MDAAAAAFGLALPAAEREECELWPENAKAIALFEALMSQWRMGAMGGATGLDYAAIPAVAAMLGLRGGALRRAFDGLRLMEAEALRWFAEQRRG